MRLTIREYLEITQPEVLAALEALARLAGPLAPGPEEGQLVDVTVRLFEAEEVDPEIERLMRHDAYRRGPRGALRQVRHG